MNNDNKIIPNYRFPEFKNDGNWIIEKIDNLFKSYSGGTPTSTEGKYYNGTIPFIRSAEIDRKTTELFLTEDGLNSSSAKMVKHGDLLVALYGANSGDVAISKINGAINQAILCLKSSNYNLYTKYYLEYSKNSIVNKFIQGGQGNLSGDIIKSILLPIPPIKSAEQQKIAACLSSLDDVIAGHEEKLTALEEHKKGLMQNLFPQEGETQPKYRFPEFENDGNWVEKKLGDVIELKGRIGYRGYTVEDIVNKGEGAITLSPSNIENNGSLNFDKLTYISWFKYEESPEIMLTEGFTVLVKTGSTYGKAAFIKDLPEKATVNPQIVVLKPLNINPYFLYLIVSNTKIQKQINETVVGGAIPTLSQDSILKFQFHLPVNNSEQQKIASVLSSVDELIVAQREKIEALKEHKKGLMQGLFPKIES